MTCDQATVTWTSITGSPLCSGGLLVMSFLGRQGLSLLCMRARLVVLCSRAVPTVLHRSPDRVSCLHISFSHSLENTRETCVCVIVRVCVIMCVYV